MLNFWFKLIAVSKSRRIYERGGTQGEQVKVPLLPYKVGKRIGTAAVCDRKEHKIRA